MSKYVMTIEVKATDVLDEKNVEYFEGLTLEQRHERIGEMKTDIKRMFQREMDEGAEINVSVHVEKEV
jgi:hypothetical protein